jgi:hypothetical protein
MHVSYVYITHAYVPLQYVMETIYLWRYVYFESLSEIAFNKQTYFAYNSNILLRRVVETLSVGLGTLEIGETAGRSGVKARSGESINISKLFLNSRRPFLV